MSTDQRRQCLLPALVSSCVILATIACAGGATQAPSTAGPQVGATESSPPEPATPTAAEEPTPAQLPPLPEPLYLGDTDLASGYSLTALAIWDPATPGMYYEPQSGRRLVAVELAVGNVSGDPLSVNPLYASLVDAEGYVYEVDVLGLDSSILPAIDALPGERVRGWVAFTIPDAAVPASVKYQADLFGEEVLQVGLAAPPEGYTSSTPPWTPLSLMGLPLLGQSDQRYGYSFTAIAVEDPSAPGMFYEAPAGHKLVAVEVELANESGEVLSVSPSNAILIDSEGYLYTAELGGRDDLLAYVDIGQGERVRGWLAFTVPETSVPASVRFLTQVFGSAYLQVGLSSP